MLSILAALVLLSVIVAIHEAGHCWVAKRAGLFVPTFSIGFGPVLWRRQWGETSYEIAAIPLGGFVRFFRDPADASRTRDDEEAKAVGTSRIPADLPLQRTMIGITRPWQAAILLAGVTANLVTAWIAIVALLAVIGEPTPIAGAPTVSAIVAQSPAAAAGLRAGDRVLARDGRAITTLDGLQLKDGTPTRLTIDRMGSPREIVVTPRLDSASGAWRVGVQLQPALGNPTRVPLPAAIVGATVGTGRMLVLQANGIKRLVTNFGQAKQEISGPVGIIKASAAATRAGPSRILEIFIAISLSLVLFNLIPLAPLDGGQLLWVGVGGLLRREVPLRLQNGVNAIGVVLLLGLMTWATFNDILG